MRKKKFIIPFLSVIILITCRFGFRENNEYIATINLNQRDNAEDIAKMLINDVYGGVVFKEQKFDNGDCIVRYFCSNVCIDVCKDGKIRYLCDITANSETDLFREWLFKKEDAVVMELAEDDGFIYENIEGRNIFANLCVDSSTNRIIAAEITLKYN